MTVFFGCGAAEVWGEVWTAPVTVVSVDDIRGKIEKELAEKEYQLKQKKKNTGKKQNQETASSAAPVAGDNSAIEIDCEVWPIPSEDEGPTATSAKVAKASKNDSAAVAARKLERDRAQKWKVEVSKATRCINSLNSVCLSLTNTMVQEEP